jgi:site-specific DNA-methyltransferase (adenine-specific)
MHNHRRFLNALNILDDQKTLRAFAKRSGVSAKRLSEIDADGKFPIGTELGQILEASGITETELRLRTGHLDFCLLDKISENYSALSQLLTRDEHPKELKAVEYSFGTSLGNLYNGDCLDLLRSLESESVDVVFADPPFNLKKLYPSGIDDDLSQDQYLKWCEKWITECCRVLKTGGRFFLWNIPRWNIHLGKIADQYLHFQHWISTDVKYSLPISGRLYPSHYSLLYYTKGRSPNCFHPDRLAMSTCPACHKEIKDYGGYKNKMNPAGISLTDVWLDIPPVRHQKYKGRKDGNELSLKLLDRVIEMASDEDDVILDPFGGAGTTFIAAELKGRRWVGSEIGPVDDIKARFSRIGDERIYLEKIRSGVNALFPPDIHRMRRVKGIWTPEDFNDVQGDLGPIQKQLGLIDL